MSTIDPNQIETKDKTVKPPRKVKATITKDEMDAVIRERRASLQTASKTLTELARLLSSNSDFTFSALAETKRALTEVNGLEKDLKEIKNILILRGKAKCDEEVRA